MGWLKIDKITKNDKLTTEKQMNLKKPTSQSNLL